MDLNTGNTEIFRMDNIAPHNPADLSASQTSTFAQSFSNDLEGFGQDPGQSMMGDILKQGYLSATASKADDDDVTSRLTGPRGPYIDKRKGEFLMLDILNKSKQNDCGCINDEVARRVLILDRHLTC